MLQKFIEKPKMMAGKDKDTNCAMRKTIVTGVGTGKSQRKIIWIIVNGFENPVCYTHQQKH